MGPRSDYSLCAYCQPIVSWEGSVLFSKLLLTAREHSVIQSVYVFTHMHTHTHTLTHTHAHAHTHTHTHTVSLKGKWPCRVFSRVRQ